MTSSLTQFVSSASRANCAVRTASAAPPTPGGVRQRFDSEATKQVQNAGAAGRVDSPHRDGGQFGTGGDKRFLEDRKVGGAACPRDEPGTETAARDSEKVLLSHPAPP